MIKLVAAAALIACAATSCSPVAPAASKVIDATAPSVPLLRGESINLGAWSSSDELILSFAPGLPVDEQLRVVDIESVAESPVVVSGPAACNRRALSAIDRVSDGRIVIINSCRLQDASGDFSEDHDIELLDTATGVVTLVARLVDQSGVGPAAVRDDLEQTVIPVGSRICETLAFIEDEALVPFDLIVREGDRSFNLADELLNEQPGCQDQGVADSPDWSSDGRTLVFAASVDAIGMDGTDRLDAARSLYLWTGEPEVSPILGGLRHVRYVRWDPTGTWLAFGADIEGYGPGTWMFNPADDRLVRVTHAQGITLAWSPDGKSLALSHTPADADTLEREILILDVRDVITE